MQYENNPADRFFEISSGNTDAQADMVKTISPTPTLWAGDNKFQLNYLIFKYNSCAFNLQS